ncbi:MAG: hypothetical protein IT371_11500 [Deltaproteobacteria bacterium]|nr:hypothetical protein [Deltaproteobacteria bacterium]
MTRTIALLCLVWPLAARASEPDEPGAAAAARRDEPAEAASALPRVTAPPALRPTGPRFRLELAFGYASLVVDPNLKQGIGAGMYVAYGLRHRVGVELTVFLSSNAYTGELGLLSSPLLVGNVTLGPIVQLTRPGGRVMLTADLGLGTYVVAQTLQPMVWSLGLSAGLTFGYRISSWFGVGVKWRYHLYNLATLGSPDLLDIKSFTKVGVLDRMEIPAYLAFYF